jgi:hypothetical protein
LLRRIEPNRVWSAISAKRWWQKGPVTKESAKETVKTIAQEMPGVPVNLW